MRDDRFADLMKRYPNTTIKEKMELLDELVVQWIARNSDGEGMEE